MKQETNIWLSFSRLGLLVSFALIWIFDLLEMTRFSSEVIVFGVMVVTMGAAIDRLSPTEK